MGPTQYEKSLIAKIGAAIRELYPSAVRYGVSVGNHPSYGYDLIDVAFDDGTVITADSGTFAALAASVSADLGTLKWGAFGDGGTTVAFDVDLATGTILRAS